MSKNGRLFDSPQLAALFAATRAQQAIEKSKYYGTKKKREALVAAVTRAIEPFCSNDAPAGQSLGFVHGFLVAWTRHDTALLSVIEKYGLYFAGMVALSLARPCDSVSQISILTNIVEAWKSGKISTKQKKPAAQPRSHFVELAREIVKNDPTASATEKWNKLIGPAQQVEIRGALFAVDVTEKDGHLHWEAEEYGADQDEEKTSYEGKISWEQFPSFISKCK